MGLEPTTYSMPFQNSTHKTPTPVKNSERYFVNNHTYLQISKCKQIFTIVQKNYTNYVVMLFYVGWFCQIQAYKLKDMLYTKKIMNIVQERSFSNYVSTTTTYALNLNDKLGLSKNIITHQN